MALVGFAFVPYATQATPRHFRRAKASINRRSQPPLREPRLLLPVAVSTASEGVQIIEDGTKAYLPHTISIDSNLSPTKKRDVLREHAQRADFFTKPFSDTTRKITERLLEHGISVETPLDVHLKNGRAIFEKVGHSLGSERGQKILGRDHYDFEDRLATMIAAMHSAGVTHNHLHADNVTITRAHQPEIIDLSEATIFELPLAPDKDWFRTTFESDLTTIGHSLAFVYADVARTKGSAIPSSQNLHTSMALSIQNIFRRYSAPLQELITMEDHQWVGQLMRDAQNIDPRL